MAEKLSEVRSAHSSKHLERADAVLALKKSTERAQAEIRGANERRAERRRAIEIARDSEREQILAAGGNPYQVFRAREEKARQKKERKQLDATLATNMSALQARLLKEQAEETRKRAEARRNKAAAEAAAKEITVNGQEKRDDDFMRRVTKTKASLLDPTSKLGTIHPTEHTTIKNWKFGLGLNDDPDILVMMAGKHPDVTAEHERRVADKKARAAALADAGVERGEKGTVGVSLAARASPSVSAMSAVAKATGLGVDVMLRRRRRAPEVRPPAGGAGGGVGGGAGGVGGFGASALKGARELSALEKRYMGEARERQRANITVTQVVGGKEWEGAAFIAKPAVLGFTDFVVGETYTLKFTLTNISYSFNSFRPGELPENVRDFFVLTHAPPGRMSAGTSCVLTLTFTPKLNQDIDVTLPFTCATGPMEVPVRCTTKKVVLSLSAPALDFGGVVSGEASSLTLTTTSRCR